MSLEKTYSSQPAEEKWLSLWKKARLFASKPETGKAGKFVVVIPPPNVTGALHLGHALNNTLQDVLVRWHKLLGFESCWIPGTDHGGIATQNVMEKQLKAENLSRYDLGREKFLQRTQSWTRDCRKTILGQLDKLGCALDFEREAFTMDEKRAHAVFTAFKVLWDKGLIYRGERLVNWCVRCGTALSDIEVEHEERKGHLWHIHYPLSDNSEGLVVATTRPETMLGDTAVAVNPKDSRYTHLIGKKLRLPLVGREIPVVADAAVDSAFGTGAVKVTPAHDPNDFEIGRRHNLPTITVIGLDGRITPEGGLFAGLSREQAREKIVKDIDSSALLRKTEDIRHAVGVCYRCATIIEPLLSDQWWVKMESLAKPAIAALETGAFRISPGSWAKPYLDWLGSVRDWCISRQIWWGHRIPVWYCRACFDDKLRAVKAGTKPVVSQTAPASCGNCGGKDFKQDPDVLDTWFSSALWPMSVFGWPEQTADFKFYYPTSVLVTGYEILYLWVARMQMMGLEFTGKPPFKDAVIHGIVRDKTGKKMSKSLGNVIDPLTMMDKFGSDALRFSLMIQARPGKDIHFAEDSIVGSRNFANKLWNSTRFVLMNLPETPAAPYLLKNLSHCCLELCDQWILAEYQAMLAGVAQKMDVFDVAGAGDEIYGFLWDKFCDWYVELAKIRLQGIDGEDKEACRAILVQVLSGTLKVLHPFMPYITEELYSALKSYSGESADFILKSGAPNLDFDWANSQAQEQMQALMQMTTAIRSLRAQLNVPPGLKIKAIVSGGTQGIRELVSKYQEYLKSLARLEEINFSSSGGRPAQSATAVAAGTTFFIPLSGIIDFAQERSRLGKEFTKAEAELKKIAAKIENKDFLARAPESEVALARAQHEAAAARHLQLKETLSILAQC